jgi:integrase
VNLTEAVDAFLDSRREARRRASTLTHYRRILTAHARALGPGRDVTTITPAQVERWFASLHYTPGGMYNHYVIVNSFWTWLQRSGHVARSPVLFTCPQPPVSLIRNRSISDADLAAMLAAARSDPRDYALLRFLADTGARAGAVAGVRLADLDLDSGTASVLEKGNQRLTVWFGSLTAAALRDWLAVRPAWPHDHVFASARGRPLSSHGIWDVLEPIAQRAGAVGRWNPHAFRHHGGKTWFDAGKPLPLVQLKLGHSRAETTARYYANRSADELRDGTEELAPPDPECR